MQPSSILLINSNVSNPPVSPVGLEYVAEALVESKIPLNVLDLALSDDWKTAIANALESGDTLAVAISVRNTDDCCFVTRKSFLPWIKEVVDEVRRYSQSPVILGGGGFSVMPEAVLRYTKAHIGIVGDAEQTMIRLIRKLQNETDYSDLPNLVLDNEDRITKNNVIRDSLDSLPVPRRRVFDNLNYQELGAMVGIETKRGCPNKCVYCADPVIKGRRVRFRPIGFIVAELKDILSQGVSWFHLSDSEFNVPINHAKEICRAIIDAGISNKINWYCYCSPVPFDAELASLMRRAGCKGINFGVDSLCNEQLLRLGREFNLDSVRSLVGMLNKGGLNYIFDLLIGGPGETEYTINESISNIKKLGTPSCGISIGVRVYPGTYLAKSLSNGPGKEGLHPPNSPDFEPTFFVSPYLQNDAQTITENAVGNDSRFLLLSNPSEHGSYNYADDKYLFDKIKSGERGAYWDIIKRNTSLDRRTAMS